MSGILSGLVGSFKSIVAVITAFTAKTFGNTATSPTSGDIISSCTDSNFNLYTLSSVTGGAIVAKYNISGTLLWQSQITIAKAACISIDNSTNVYIGGAYTYSTTAGVSGIPAIVKFDTNGNFQWFNTYTQPSQAITLITQIKFDSSSNIICGAWGPYGYYSGGTNQGYVVKMDPTGSTISWTALVNLGTQMGSFDQIAIDSSGNIYASFQGYGSNSAPSTAEIVKLNPSTGALVWSYYIQNTNFSPTIYSTTLTTDSSGNIYLAGVGGNGLFFIIKYNSAGTIQYQYEYSSNGNYTYVQNVNILLDNAGDIYISGSANIGTVGFLMKITSSTGAIVYQNEINNLFIPRTILVQTGAVNPTYTKMAGMHFGPSNTLILSGGTLGYTGNSGFAIAVDMNGSSGFGKYDIDANTSITYSPFSTLFTKAGTTTLTTTTPFQPFAIDTNVVSKSTSYTGVTSTSSYINTSYTATNPTAIATISYTNATRYSDSIYYYLVYKTVGTFTNDIVISGGPIVADVFIVAGGGGGGAGIATTYCGGGGGGGGIVYSINASLAVGSYSATVGAGGTAALSSIGGNGGNSSFTGFTTAIGGGGGGYNATPGQNGGNGGGGFGHKVAGGGGAGGTGTAGQGNNGGVGFGTATAVQGGKGGGWNQAASTLSSYGLAEIAGSILSISGISSTGETIGAGGTFSGSAAGTANTGAGGSGTTATSVAGGVGGSGTVLIRYARSQIVGG